MIFIDTNCLASEKGSYKDKGSLNSSIAELIFHSMIMS